MINKFYVRINQNSGSTQGSYPGHGSYYIAGQEVFALSHIQAFKEYFDYTRQRYEVVLYRRSFEDLKKILMWNLQKIKGTIRSYKNSLKAIIYRIKHQMKRNEKHLPFFYSRNKMIMDTVSEFFSITITSQSY